jgi:hypothetical protein
MSLSFNPFSMPLYCLNMSKLSNFFKLMSVCVPIQ